MLWYILEYKFKREKITNSWVQCDRKQLGLYFSEHSLTSITYNKAQPVVNRKLNSIFRLRKEGWSRPLLTKGTRIRDNATSPVGAEKQNLKVGKKCKQSRVHECTHWNNIEQRRKNITNNKLYNMSGALEFDVSRRHLQICTGSPWQSEHEGGKVIMLLNKLRYKSFFT